MQGIKTASIVYDCIHMCESDLDFCMGLDRKRYMATNFLPLKQPFLHPFVIFKSFVMFNILSMDFLILSQIFLVSHRNCGQWEGGEVGYFWCKMGIGRTLLSYYCSILESRPVLETVSIY